ISEVRVAKINGEYVVNPSLTAIASADLDLMVAGTAESIIMVEGEANEVSELEMVEALRVAHETIRTQVAAQKELEAQVGSTAKREYNHEVHDEALKEKMYSELFDKVYAVCMEGNPNKHYRSDSFAKILEDFVAAQPEEEQENPLFKVYFGDITYDASRKMVLEESKRLDGRSLTEIRPISVEVDYLPSAHGSALFTRGETQS